MADEPAQADPNAHPHADPYALGQPERGADADALPVRVADTRADGHGNTDPRAVRDAPVAGFRTRERHPGPSRPRPVGVLEWRGRAAITRRRRIARFLPALAASGLVSRPHSTPSICAVLLVALLLAGCGTGATATSPASSGTSAPATAPVLAWTPPPGLAPTGRTEAATVVRVVDGDTIIVRLNGRDERIRYIGMDTPESVKPDSPVEPFGAEAADENRRLVAGRAVTLERDVSDRDQYGRLLRRVWVQRDSSAGSGWILVGLELVRLGYAQAYTYPPDVKYADLIIAAQRAARETGLGLWSSPSP